MNETIEVPGDKMRIGYAKLGRSMPLTLDACGTLGGDIEMTATLTTLAQRRPHDTFVLVGRNSNDDPQAAGLPPNVENPWHEWQHEFRRFNAKLRERNVGGLTIESELELCHFFDDLTGSTFDGLDAIVMWVGQHGTSNFPIPRVEDRSALTKPQDWCMYYASFLLRGINRWRDVNPWHREEVNLNADPRNRHKMRDLKWPLRHPVLTQYEFTNNIKHERYGDPMPIAGWYPGVHDIEPGVWNAQVSNVYSRIELNALVPGTPSGDLLTFNDDWSGRSHFGLIINEARVIGVRPEWLRKTAMYEYVLPLAPAFIHGTWSATSMSEMMRDFGVDPIKPIPWSRYVSILQSTRCTFTTPSSGSGWATTKPWEAFGAGVVCFFHPKYDDQNHILRDADPALRRWLRVKTPESLRQRVKHLNSEAGRLDWEWIVNQQKFHFDNAMRNLTYVRMIEERLGQ
jgi:hypothetical protein